MDNENQKAPDAPPGTTEAERGVPPPPRDKPTKEQMDEAMFREGGNMEENMPPGS